MTLIKLLVLVLLTSPGVLTELVRTQQIVVASLGDEALVRCELTAPKDVLQVTWQRMTGGGPENMATFSERYGVKITEPFRDHVHVREEGLQHCSIAIVGVNWEDECCYKCLFNAFPDGAISGKTCLKVYELHEPMLEVRQTDDVRDDGLQVYVLSCSVTGRPAPDVSWDAENAIVENVTTTETVHNNGTATITKHAIAVVQFKLPDKEVKVKCVAEDPFRQKKKVIYRRIPTIREVTTAKNVQAPVGLPFTLSCNVTLDEWDTVKQVQWIDNHDKILLTYQPGKATSFEDEKHVHQTSSDTSYSAITLKKVGQEDDGCFTCVFDIYPSGSQKGQTCVTVTEHTYSRNSYSNWYMAVLLAVILFAAVKIGIWLHRKKCHQNRKSSPPNNVAEYPSDSASTSNTTPASSSIKIRISGETSLKNRNRTPASGKDLLEKAVPETESSEKKRQIGNKCKRSLFEYQKTP